jgi:ribosomal protein L31E
MSLASAIVGRTKKSAGKKVAGPMTVGVRASAEWAERLERAAKHCRTDIAKLIDNSVADYVKARGFDEPPPERVP